MKKQILLIPLCFLLSFCQSEDEQQVDPVKVKGTWYLKEISAGLMGIIPYKAGAVEFVFDDKKKSLTIKSKLKDTEEKDMYIRLGVKKKENYTYKITKVLDKYVLLIDGKSNGILEIKGEELSIDQGAYMDGDLIRLKR